MKIGAKAKVRACTLPFRPLSDYLFAAQRGCCFHCLHPMTPQPHSKRNPNGWTREHVTPQSARGKKTGNIVLAHQLCNVRRGDMPLGRIETYRARIIITAAMLAHARQGGDQ